MKKRPPARTIKIPASSYMQLRALVGTISALGWTSVASKRNDRPTLSSVVDEAIAQLERRRTMERRP